MPKGKSIGKMKNRLAKSVFSLIDSHHSVAVDEYRVPEQSTRKYTDS